MVAAMGVVRILDQDAVGERRAVALDGEGAAVGLFLDRWADRGRRARLGERLPALARSVDAAQGGVFLELEQGEAAFLPTKHAEGIAEGARLAVRIAAEARRGKLARVAPWREGDVERSPFEAWRATLAGGAAAGVDRVGPEDEAIDAAVEESLAPAATLAGGGRIRFAETPALTAVDIDTAGRRGTGGARAQALATTLAAIDEAARQIALRGLGGLVVLDCLSAAGRSPKLRERFDAALKGRLRRRFKVAPWGPTGFGLLEANLEWTAAPIAHILQDDGGATTPETELWAAVRAAEREAAAAPSAFLTLDLPPRLDPASISGGLQGISTLRNRYRGRIDVAFSDRPTWGVTRR